MFVLFNYNAAAVAPAAAFLPSLGWSAAGSQQMLSADICCLLPPPPPGKQQQLPANSLLCASFPPPSPPTPSQSSLLLLQAPSQDLEMVVSLVLAQLQAAFRLTRP